MNVDTTGTDCPFTFIHNFRDVGSTVNASSPRRLMKERMLYRSGRLDDATADDRRKLAHDYGIKTVIDLRTKSEHIIREQRGHFGNGLDKYGVQTVNVHFVGKKFEMALMKRLGWWDIMFRASAVRIIGEKVLKQSGLGGLSLASLEYCGDEIRASLEILSDPFAYPVLMHCTQGKDRTGLLSILLLLLLGIPTDAIKRDYMDSWEGLAPVRSEMLKEIEEIGLDAAFARAEGPIVDKVQGHLLDRWGGAEGYLERVGVTVDKREMLVKILGV